MAAPKSQKVGVGIAVYITNSFIEMLGVFGPEAHCFIRDLCCYIAVTTLDPLSAHHLRQRIAVAVQRGNAAAIQGTSYSFDFASGPFFLQNRCMFKLLCLCLYMCVFALFCVYIFVLLFVYLCVLYIPSYCIVHLNNKYTTSHHK